MVTTMTSITRDIRKIKRMTDAAVYGLAVHADDSELQAKAGRVAHKRAEQYAIANR